MEGRVIWVALLGLTQYLVSIIKYCQRVFCCHVVDDGRNCLFPFFGYTCRRFMHRLPQSMSWSLVPQISYSNLNFPSHSSYSPSTYFLPISLILPPHTSLTYSVASSHNNHTDILQAPYPVSYARSERFASSTACCRSVSCRRSRIRCSSSTAVGCFLCSSVFERDLGQFPLEQRFQQVP